MSFNLNNKLTKWKLKKIKDYDEDESLLIYSYGNYTIEKLNNENRYRLFGRNGDYYLFSVENINQAKEIIEMLVMKGIKIL